MRIKSLVITVGLSALVVCGSSFAKAGYDDVYLVFNDGKLAGNVASVKGVFYCTGLHHSKKFNLTPIGGGQFVQHHQSICPRNQGAHGWGGASIFATFKDNQSYTVSYDSRHDMHANKQLVCIINGNNENDLTSKCSY